MGLQNSLARSEKHDKAKPHKNYKKFLHAEVLDHFKLLYGGPITTASRSRPRSSSKPTPGRKKSPCEENTSFGQHAAVELHCNCKSSTASRTLSPVQGLLAKREKHGDFRLLMPTKIPVPYPSLTGCSCSPRAGWGFLEFRREGNDREDRLRSDGLGCKDQLP